MSQRFEGRNLEDALTNAAQTLGVERYQLTYHVLVEKRGFLGGMKRVVIEAEVNASPSAQAVAPPAAPQEEYRQPREARPRGPRGGGGGGGARGGGGGGGRRGGRGRGRGGGGGGRGRERDRDRDRPRESEPVAWVAAEEVPEQAVESDLAQLVRAWFEQVLELTRLDLEIRTDENDAQIIVRLYGRDGAKLLEHHGELLDALQVLANKALVGRRIEKDIELDCSAFKEKRMEELGERARETADRVRRDGREQLLPAMSPIERRIIHLALQDDAEVMTESRGDGFYKRVAIKLKPAGAEQTSTTTES
jgi:predicted RNA-binding protein Jag